jgi:hypothetical protein
MKKDGFILSGIGLAIFVLTLISDLLLGKGEIILGPKSIPVMMVGLILLVAGIVKLVSK